MPKGKRGTPPEISAETLKEFEELDRIDAEAEAEEAAADDAHAATALDDVDEDERIVRDALILDAVGGEPVEFPHECDGTNIGVAADGRLYCLHCGWQADDAPAQDASPEPAAADPPPSPTPLFAEDTFDAMKAFDEIKDAHRLVASAQTAYEWRKAEASEAKKLLDARQGALSALIARLEYEQRKADQAQHQPKLAAVEEPASPVEQAVDLITEAVDHIVIDALAPEPEGAPV